MLKIAYCVLIGSFVSIIIVFIQDSLWYEISTIEYLTLLIGLSGLYIARERGHKSIETVIKQQKSDLAMKFLIRQMDTLESRTKNDDLGTNEKAELALLYTEAIVKANTLGRIILGKKLSQDDLKRIELWHEEGETIFKDLS